LNACSSNATGEFTLTAHVDILLELAEPIIIKLMLKHFANGVHCFKKFSFLLKIKHGMNVI
jgi:hypothetical protein